MQTLGTVLRTLLGVPLFLYLPGYALDRGWLATASSVRGIERHISRIVASALLTGWIALVLAELGVFSFWLLLALIAGLCLLGALLRRSAFIAAPPLGIIADRPATTSGRATLTGMLAAIKFDHVLLAIALLFGVLVARPFEVIRGGLDAGVYANTGVAIARTGSIVQYDPIVAEIGQLSQAGDETAQHIERNLLGVQSRDRYIATRYRAAGFFINDGELASGRVVPQFFHLWPVWLAIFVAMLGPTLGLAATGAAGALGVVLLGLIGRRLGGSLVGLLAASFLALLTPQVWFSRMPTSEALAQALLLAGLWAWTHFADADNRRERIWWGVIVGAAFGQLTLTRIDGVFATALTGALLVYAAYTRRWHAGYSALALTLGALLVHTLLHILLIARAYFFDTAYARLQDFAFTIYLSLPFLSAGVSDRFRFRGSSKYMDPYRIWIELVAIALLLLTLVALWRWRRPLLLLEAVTRRWRRWLLGAVVLTLALLAGYAYLIRPEIITADALLHPLRPDNWLRLQGYIGAPIEVPLEKYCEPGKKCKTTEIIALGNMARFGWYLSPLGVLLGVAGGLLLWRRLDRRSWLFVLIATIYSLFYIRSLYGTGDQTYIYILRRYVPLVYPAFVLAMAYALAALKGRAEGARRTALDWLRLGAFALGAPSLLLFFAVTGRTVYAHVEYGGSLAQIETLSDHFRQEDVILVRGGGAGDVAVRDTSELVATPLTYIFGRNALPIKGVEPAHYAVAFGEQVTRWRAEGRRVYALLSASGGDLLFPGYQLRPVDRWTLMQHEFQQLANQKPKLSYTNEVPFQLYEIVPAAAQDAPVALTYDDTAAQVAGFYRSEPAPPGQTRAAWTNGLAVLRLPSNAQSRILTLDVAGGKRPAAIGSAQLCIDVAAEPIPHPEGGVARSTPIVRSDKTTIPALPWRELQCIQLAEASSSVQVALPALEPSSAVLIRLRSQPWTPSQVSDSPDQRILGIRFNSAVVAP
jgi:hypothetical protein